MSIYKTASKYVLFCRYRLVDNLAGAELPVGEEESKDKVAPLPAPPQSVLAGDAMPLSGGDEYGFRPTLGEVPSFSLPSTLPNLPMVAEISWSGTSHSLAEKHLRHFHLFAVKQNRESEQQFALVQHLPSLLLKFLHMFLELLHMSWYLQ
jgi:hypothetical protein